MNDLVSVIEIDSDRKLTWVIRIEVVFAIFSLFLIYTEITFVFKRINQNLEDKNKNLAESNELLEQYAYLAAHDLRSPTQTILNFLKILKRKLSGRLDEKEQEYFSFVEEAAVRMKSTTNDLLQFSSINQAKLQIVSVKPKAIFQNVIKDLESNIDEKKADVYLGDLPDSIYGDQHMLHLVFQNLIANGLKFVAENEIPKIDIKYENENGNHTFSINDNGIGISKDNQERIFRLFNRLHGFTEYQGTGIGLSICQKVVEKHKGSIRVESEPEKGSTFFVSIPERLAN